MHIFLLHSHNKLLYELQWKNKINYTSVYALLLENYFIVLFNLKLYLYSGIKRAYKCILTFFYRQAHVLVCM